VERPLLDPSRREFNSERNPFQPGAHLRERKRIAAGERKRIFKMPGARL